MILFDLICSQGHGFEAWFRDGESFDRLQAVGEIQCSVCGDRDVKKALMAPNISTSKNTDGRAAQARDDEVSDRSRDTAAKVKTTEDAPAVVAIQEDPGAIKGPNGMPVPEKIAEAMQVLRQVQTHIEKTFDHVGKRFAEEARKMHYGETEKRSIYGEATNDEAEELIEEGIEVNQMPWLPRRDS
ncbi:MAG: DUF1178 family protein [Geminicoccaceae bacterium]